MKRDFKTALPSGRRGVFGDVGNPPDAAIRCGHDVTGAPHVDASHVNVCARMSLIYRCPPGAAVLAGVEQVPDESRARCSSWSFNREIRGASSSGYVIAGNNTGEEIEGSDKRIYPGKPERPTQGITGATAGSRKANRQRMTFSCEERRIRALLFISLVVRRV